MSVLEEYHICTRCQKRLTDGRHKTCEYCREQMRDYQRRNAEKINAYMKTRRKMHKILGLCVYCKRPVSPGFTMCKRHLEEGRRWRAEHKERTS